jgi:RecA-family ATPase
MKYYLKPEIVAAIKLWHKDLLFVYDRKCNGMDTKLLLTAMEELAKKKDGPKVRLFIIDNLMTILEEKADSLNSDQANFVQKCKNFAQENHVHVILVCHPTKDKKESRKGEPNLEKTDISGSNNIANKASNIIAIERNYDTDNFDWDCMITNLKDKEDGQRAIFNYKYHQRTHRFYNNDTPANVEYGWEKFL